MRHTEVTLQSRPKMLSSVAFVSLEMDNNLRFVVCDRSIKIEKDLNKRLKLIRSSQCLRKKATEKSFQL